MSSPFIHTLLWIPLSVAEKGFVESEKGVRVYKYDPDNEGELQEMYVQCPIYLGAFEISDKRRKSKIGEIRTMRTHEEKDSFVITRKKSKKNL